MEKYKFFEHTADAKFQAYGKNLQEAFGNAALAMFSIIIDTEKVKGEIRHDIECSSKDLKALLYDFLGELVFLIDTEDFLLSNVEEVKIFKDGLYFLRAVVAGDKAGNYEPSGDIKAVTYNEMEIKKGKNKVMVQVVIDL